MRIDDFYTVYYEQKFNSRNEVYHFIAKNYGQSEKQRKTIVDSFIAREEAGNIQIASHVLLPHSEVDDLESSYICLVKLAEPINEWSADIKEVKLIVAILLKREETPTVKKEITCFMRHLADEEYIDQLLLAKNVSELNKLLKKLK